ncbi:MAG: hypothetical protein D6677_10265 [Calditrichaeota bacterium]|nr:MAG: hypothetical protein D6677_10265 [Calditrichota bacterium]
MTQEQKLQKLIALLESYNIPVKSDRGNFRGGLVRYRDAYYFYMNRKLDVDAKIRLIEREFKNWPLESEEGQRVLQQLLEQPVS